MCPHSSGLGQPPLLKFLPSEQRDEQDGDGTDDAEDGDDTSFAGGPVLTLDQAVRLNGWAGGEQVGEVESRHCETLFLSFLQRFAKVAINLHASLQ